jgi:hypothetical protein
MKKISLFVSVFFLVLFTSLAKAQSTSNTHLVRSTIGISGTSENVTVNNKQYIVQQSIGQASVIGTFSDSDYILRQGFIQPNVLAKIIDIAIPLNLEAIVYPNPFVENITIAFTEKITDKIEVHAFDLLGRLVFSKSYLADQNLKVNLPNLANAEYFLKVTVNNKQFLKKILKK